MLCLRVNTHASLLSVKQKGGKKGGGGQPERAVDISRLDIRVGVVISAEKVIMCVCIRA